MLEQHIRAYDQNSKSRKRNGWANLANSTM